MTDFQHVTWSDDDDLSAEKLNDMVANDEWLNQRILPARYQAYGLNKTDGLKIASGIINFAPTTGRTMTKDISYAGFFTQNCHPSIQATVATTDAHRTFVAIQASATGVLRPLENGFRVVLNADPLVAQKTHFPTVVHVHWLAIGY